MQLAEATRTCFRKYVTFNGRASRVEFWKFVVFIFLGLVVATVLNSLLFGPTVVQKLEVAIDASGNQVQELVTLRQYDGGWIGTAFLVVVALPLLAAGWRRLQDRGRSGWWLLLPAPILLGSYVIVYATSMEVTLDNSRLPDGIELPQTITMIGNVPIFLAAWLAAAASIVTVIVWLARKGQNGSNDYGPNPTEVNP